jgi:hypothetical protein
MRICIWLGYKKRNEKMTSKLTVAAVLVALSGMAVVAPANAASRPITEQARQSYNSAAPVSADAPDAHQYHGGPKAND